MVKNKTFWTQAGHVKEMFSLLLERNNKKFMTSFCKKENENMIHLLWECENVQILLEALDNWTLKNGNFTLNYNKKTFILGYHKEKNSLISNKILLAIKYYIYTCNCL